MGTSFGEKLFQNSRIKDVQSKKKISPTEVFHCRKQNAVGVKGDTHK